MTNTDKIASIIFAFLILTLFIINDLNDKIRELQSEVHGLELDLALEKLNKSSEKYKLDLYERLVEEQDIMIKMYESQQKTKN